MRNKFEREMSELMDEMLKMSEFVVSVIKDAMKALRTGDRVQVGDTVIAVRKK